MYSNSFKTLYKPLKRINSARVWLYYTKQKALETPKNVQKKTREKVSRVKPIILSK